jgi:hypothetical protein
LQDTPKFTQIGVFGLKIYRLATLPTSRRTAASSDEDRNETFFYFLLFFVCLLLQLDFGTAVRGTVANWKSSDRRVRFTSASIETRVARFYIAQHTEMRDNIPK